MNTSIASVTAEVPYGDAVRGRSRAPGVDAAVDHASGLGASNRLRSPPVFAAEVAPPALPNRADLDAPFAALAAHSAPPLGAGSDTPVAAPVAHSAPPPSSTFDAPLASVPVHSAAGGAGVFSDDEPDGVVAGGAAPQSVEAPAATVTVITRAAAAGVAKLEVLWMLDMCSGIFKRV